MITGLKRHVQEGQKNLKSQTKLKMSTMRRGAQRTAESAASLTVRTSNITGNGGSGSGGGGQKNHLAHQLAGVPGHLAQETTCKAHLVEVFHNLLPQELMQRNPPWVVSQMDAAERKLGWWKTKL